MGDLRWTPSSEPNYLMRVSETGKPGKDRNYIPEGDDGKIAICGKSVARASEHETNLLVNNSQLMTYDCG